MENNNTKVIKTLDQLGNVFSVISLLGLLGIPLAFILWIWLGFTIFFKTILTAIIVLLIGQFFVKIFKRVKEQVKK